MIAGAADAARAADNRAGAVVVQSAANSQRHGRAAGAAGRAVKPVSGVSAVAADDVAQVSDNAVRRRAGPADAPGAALTVFAPLRDAAQAAMAAGDHPRGQVADRPVVEQPDAAVLTRGAVSVVIIPVHAGRAGLRPAIDHGVRKDPVAWGGPTAEALLGHRSLRDSARPESRGRDVAATLETRD
jgi:hypothetical protein